VNYGWWDNALLWGIPITFFLFFLYSGFKLAISEAQDEQPAYDPSKYRS
jgi:hypothetical protein